MDNNKTYVAGGMYMQADGKIGFSMINAAGNEPPFLTHDSTGLQITGHHASLYYVSEDVKTLTLIRLRGGGTKENPVPDTVMLTEKQILLIKRAMEANYYFD